MNSILIHDSVTLEKERAALRRFSARTARRIGKWKCPECKTKIISANAKLCRECADKEITAIEE